MIIALLSKSMKEEGSGKKKKKKSKKDDKFGKVMHEYKHGELHSGSKKGPVVTKRNQAIAIAASEAGIGYKKAMKPSEVSAELQKSYPGPEAVSESPKRLNCWAINRALGIIMDLRLALTDAEIAVKIDQLKAVLEENLVEGDEKTLVLKKMEQLKMVNHMDERKIDPLQQVIRSLVEAAIPPPINKSVRTAKPSLFQRIFAKAKYTKRTGSPRHYKYEYGSGQGGGSQSTGEPKVGSKAAALAEAKKLRAEGKTVKVYKEAGVRTVPGKGITPYVTYFVKEAGSPDKKESSSPVLKGYDNAKVKSALASVESLDDAADIPEKDSKMFDDMADAGLIKFVSERDVGGGTSVVVTEKGKGVLKEKK